LEKAIAHLDDWQDALERERESNITWSAVRYQQANLENDQGAFCQLIAEHVGYAAEAARIDKSRRSWTAIRKILHRMKDNRHRYYKIVLAEKQDPAVRGEEEKLLETLDQCLERDARRVETLAVTDDPSVYPNGIWGDLLPWDIISDDGSDEIQQARGLGEGDTGSLVSGELSLRKIVKDETDEMQNAHNPCEVQRVGSLETQDGRLR
jgi:hypothetical protein